MQLIMVVLALVQGGGAPQEPRQEEKVVVVASPLSPQSVFDIPYAAYVVDVEDVERQMARTIPEALKETPGITVQKTAHGHGSPFIRGFTGFRTVFLIDGIRLNNSTFRDGPNQYWNTVDPHLVQRLEIIKGPGSVLYGSDAIGGVVYAHTRTIEKFTPSLDLRARSFYRYASAEDSHTAHQELSATTSGANILLGGTYRDYGDLVAGRHTGEQPETGYGDYHVDGKVIVNVAPHQKLTFALQGARQDDVPRTHRTIFGKEWHGTIVDSAANGSNDLRHDFDQERDLLYIQYRWEEMKGVLDDVYLSVSYHRQFEDLNRVRNDSSKEFRETEVRTGGVWGKFAKKTGYGLLTFGGEFYVDNVQTEGFNRSAGGVVTQFDRGEVADDAIYDLAGVYVQDELSLDSLDLTFGLRYSWIRVNADEVDPAGIGAPPLDSIEETYSALVASARAVYHATENVNLVGGVSQGFRAPNLDDLTAVRLVLSGQTDFPNPDVDPERSINFEAGARADYESLTAGAFVFYTLLDDFIARRREPSLGPTAFVKDNFSDGYVYGVELYGEYRLGATWVFWADFTWSIGNVDANVNGAATERPISKMNPATGHLGVRYAPKDEKYFMEAVITAAREQRRLSPSDETDTSRIPPGGTPGYTVVTVRGGTEILDNVRASVAVENVTNKDYRVHGSGVNEAGTNFVFSLDVRF